MLNLSCFKKLLLILFKYMCFYLCARKTHSSFLKHPFYPDEIAYSLCTMGIGRHASGRFFFQGSWSRLWRHRYVDPWRCVWKKKVSAPLNEYQLPVVCHQFHAKGTGIKEFCRSFEYYLNLSMECNPVIINSHTGRDYFTTDEQLKVIDTAQEFFSKKQYKNCSWNTSREDRFQPL